MSTIEVYEVAGLRDGDALFVREHASLTPGQPITVLANGKKAYEGTPPPGWDGYIQIIERTNHVNESRT